MTSSSLTTLASKSFHGASTHYFPNCFKIWNLEDVQNKPTHVINLLLLLIDSLFTTKGETDSADPDSLNFIDWTEAAPSPTLLKAIKESLENSDKTYNDKEISKILENKSASVDELSTELASKFKLEKCEVEKLIKSVEYQIPTKSSIATDTKGVLLRKKAQLNDLRAEIVEDVINKLIEIATFNPDSVLQFAVFFQICAIFKTA